MRLRLEAGSRNEEDSKGGIGLRLEAGSRNEEDSQGGIRLRLEAEMRNEEDSNEVRMRLEGGMRRTGRKGDGLR